MRDPERLDDDVATYAFADDGRIPNNPRLPMLVYAGVLAGTSDAASAFERRFADHGWGGTWRDGVFPFPHFHSDAHEVLGIARGRARVRFGGDHGVVLEVEAGDAVVLPAGTGHQNLGSSPDLLVVGAYPAGQEDYDLCRGDPREIERARARIAQVPLPPGDPLHGADGPLTRLWRR